MQAAFKAMAIAYTDTDSLDVKKLAYSSIVGGIVLWRKLLLQPNVDPRLLLFPAGEKSKPLQWLTMLLVDQELYKRFHAAQEFAETVQTGQNKEDFVIKKNKILRERAESRSVIVRALAASTLLLVLRRMLSDGRGAIPWSTGRQAGSARALFLGAASLFRTVAPTMPPQFVRPTPSSLSLYAAEILHLLMHQEPGAIPAAFCLQDDAARAIHRLAVPSSRPILPLDMEAEERETFVSEFVQTLVDLNLTLPPDPDAKHEPVTLGDDIVLGWDRSLAALCPDAVGDAVSAASNITTESKAGGVPMGMLGAALPAEISRLLAQSTECLRWNAALSLYQLGVDLSVTCQDGFKRCLLRWQKQQSQGKQLIAKDLLHRAEVAAKKASAPKALGPAA